MTPIQMMGVCAVVMVILSTGIPSAESTSTTRCKNAKGENVDWWSMIKIPLMTGGKGSARVGQAFVYSDASTSYTFTYDAAAYLNGSSNALSTTIQQVYNAPATSIGWLQYNDEDPAGVSHDSNGHTKGVIGFDASGGFWLVHSVPRFPPTPYTYPAYATKYGQSFMCMSYSLSMLNKMGTNLLLNEPYVFSSNVPASLSSQVPNINAVLAKQWNTKVGASASQILTTLGGASFTTFAKNDKWGKELWQDLVAPGLKSSLLVETWMNGSGGKINTTCPLDSPDVFDISNIDAFANKWSVTQDHSKWGVSTPSSPTPWGCIGDINRVTSQSSRGGGAACISNAAYAKSLNSIIQSYWPCN